MSYVKSWTNMRANVFHIALRLIILFKGIDWKTQVILEERNEGLIFP